MNREDITRMAQEAGFVGFDGENKCLREFAALVAAAARQEEREVCLNPLNFGAGFGPDTRDVCGHRIRLNPLNFGAGFGPLSGVKLKWIGLTDEEIDKIYEAHHNQYGECETPNFGYERDIEAKLREKNG